VSLIALGRNKFLTTQAHSPRQACVKSQFASSALSQKFLVYAAVKAAGSIENHFHRWLFNISLLNERIVNIYQISITAGLRRISDIDHTALYAQRFQPGG
jgi:hypothetical protein